LSKHHHHHIGDGIHIAGDNLYSGATTLERPDNYKSSPHLALQACYLSFKSPPNSIISHPGQISEYPNSTSTRSSNPVIHSNTELHPGRISEFSGVSPFNPPLNPVIHTNSVLHPGQTQGEISGNLGQISGKTGEISGKIPSNFVSYHLHLCWWQPLSDYLSFESQ
jgi:hypothetical protein